MLNVESLGFVWTVRQVSVKPSVTLLFYKYFSENILRNPWEILTRFSSEQTLLTGKKVLNLTPPQFTIETKQWILNNLEKIGHVKNQLHGYFLRSVIYL